MSDTYTYEELDTLVGRLKQSAIDAFMCQGGQGYWSGFARSDLAVWQISADKSRYEISRNFHTGGDPTGPPGDDLTVLRPDGRGIGDGEIWRNGERDGSMKADFDRVRRKIKDLTDPWFDLPDPKKIGPYVVDDVERAYSLLIVNPEVIADAAAAADQAKTDGTADLRSFAPSLNADLQATIVTMIGATAYLHGTTALRFKASYTNTAGAKIFNFGKTAAELYGHVAGQEAMWDKARKDVASILNQCLASLDTVAAGGSDDWSQELSTIGAVADVVGGITGGPAAHLVGMAAQHGLNATGDPVRHNGLNTYDEVVDVLQKNLEDLNAGIRDQEDGIRQWAVDRLNEIWTARGNYRLRGGYRGLEQGNLGNTRGAAALHFDEIDDPDEFQVGDDSSIKWDAAIAGEIVEGMRFLAGQLEDIAKICKEPDVAEGIRSYVTRDPGVGVGGGFGPSQAVQQLNEALYDLLDNMAGDWRAGADNLQAASNYFQAAEDGNVGQLDVLRQGVDAAADDVMDGTGIKVHDYRNIDWWEKMGGS